MRPIRLVLISLLALGLAPGTWVRTPPQSRTMHDNAPVRITALHEGGLDSGPLTLAGVWQLSTKDRRFGGYSGIVSTDGDALTAISDNGKLLSIRLQSGLPIEARIRLIRRGRAARPDEEKPGYDTESLTRDPASGAIYAGFERHNAIERLSPDFVPQARVAPAEMADWGENSGPEAMTRLADGRFIVIEEGERGWFNPRHRALLFSGDPTRGARPISFTFAGITGYRPVDITPLPWAGADPDAAAGLLGIATPFRRGDHCCRSASDNCGRRMGR